MSKKIIIYYENLPSFWLILEFIHIFFFIYFYKRDYILGFVLAGGGILYALFCMVLDYLRSPILWPMQKIKIPKEKKNKIKIEYY